MTFQEFLDKFNPELDAYMQKKEREGKGDGSKYAKASAIREQINRLIKDLYRSLDENKSQKKLESIRDTLISFISSEKDGTKRVIGKCDLEKLIDAMIKDLKAIDFTDILSPAGSALGGAPRRRSSSGGGFDENGPTIRSRSRYLPVTENPPHHSHSRENSPMPRSPRALSPARGSLFPPSSPRGSSSRAPSTERVESIQGGEHSRNLFGRDVNIEYLKTLFAQDDFDPLLQVSIEEREFKGKNEKKKTSAHQMFTAQYQGTLVFGKSLEQGLDPEKQFEHYKDIFLDCFYSLFYRLILGNRVSSSVVYTNQGRVAGYVSFGIPNFKEMLKILRPKDGVIESVDLSGLASLGLVCFLAQENDFHLNNYGSSDFGIAKIDHDFISRLDIGMTPEFECFKVDKFVKYSKSDDLSDVKHFLEVLYKGVRFSPFHANNQGLVIGHGIRSKMKEGMQVTATTKTDLDRLHQIAQKTFYYQGKAQYEIVLLFNRLIEIANDLEGNRRGSVLCKKSEELLAIFKNSMNENYFDRLELFYSGHLACIVNRLNAFLLSFITESNWRRFRDRYQIEGANFPVKYDAVQFSLKVDWDKIELPKENREAFLALMEKPLYPKLASELRNHALAEAGLF